MNSLSASIVAVPVTTPDGRLLGVQTNHSNQPVLTNTDQKRAYYYDMLTTISTQSAFFKRRDLFCSLTVGDEDAAVLLTYDHVLRASLARLPFVKLQIGANLQAEAQELARGTNDVWVDGIGGNVPFTQDCEVVILDDTFTRTEIEKETFPVLISNIRRYCERVIIKASDTSTRRTLHESSVYGVVGMMKQIAFNKVHTLM